MKIAFVTETWLPSTDGVVTRLSATIDSLRGAGHEVLVIGPRESGVRGTDGTDSTDGTREGVTVRAVPSVGFRSVYGGKRWGLPLPRVARMLREFAPDVVHVVNPVLLGIVGVVAARRRFPLVASYHTDVARYAGYYRLGWLRPVIWALLRRLHNSAAVNLVTSQASADVLAEHRVRRVRLWRRGVDLDLFRPATRRMPDGKPTALYVGRLAAEKDIGRLAVLAGEDSDVNLVVVGDGPCGPALRQEMGATATFTGILRGPDLAAAYADADVFVFPSTSETLGLVLLEALACGLPVVAADSPASRELLGDCPAARLFGAEHPEYLPKLVAELTDPEAAESMRAIARREAEQWGWSAATTDLMTGYQDAIAARPARQRRWGTLRTFLAVGAVNAVLDLAVFNALLAVAPVRSALTVALSNTLAVAAALVHGHRAHGRRTFRDRRRRHRWGFGVYAVLNVAVSDAAVLLLFGAFGAAPWVGVNLAKLAAIVVASALSFLLLHVWVFPTRSPRTD